MHFSKRSLLSFCVLSATLFLAACSGEPSEADIQAAVEKEMGSSAKTMEQIGGKQAADVVKGFLPEVKSVKKIGCKEDGDNAYKCDIEMEVTQLGITNKGISPIRFVKGSDGWVATK